MVDGDLAMVAGWARMAGIVLFAYAFHLSIKLYEWKGRLSEWPKDSMNRRYLLMSLTALGLLVLMRGTVAGAIGMEMETYLAVAGYGSAHFARQFLEARQARVTKHAVPTGED